LAQHQSRMSTATAQKHTARPTAIDDQQAKTMVIA